MTETVRKVIREQKLNLEHYTFAPGLGYSREEAETFFAQTKALFLEQFGQMSDFVLIQIGANISGHTGLHPVGIGFIEKAQI